MSMIWFSYNTSKCGDEHISMKETCRLCEGNAEQHFEYNIAFSFQFGEEQRYSVVIT